MEYGEKKKPKDIYSRFQPHVVPVKWTHGVIYFSSPRTIAGWVIYLTHFVLTRQYRTEKEEQLFFFFPEIYRIDFIYFFSPLDRLLHSHCTIYFYYSPAVMPLVCVFFFSFFFFCVLFYVRPLVFYFKKIRLDGKFLRAGDSLFPFAPLSMQGNILRSKKLFIILLFFFLSYHQEQQQQQLLPGLS
jgi:hypothetical protein